MAKYDRKSVSKWRIPLNKQKNENFLTIEKCLDVLSINNLLIYSHSMSVVNAITGSKKQTLHKQKLFQVNNLKKNNYDFKVCVMPSYMYLKIKCVGVSTCKLYTYIYIYTHAYSDSLIAIVLINKFLNYLHFWKNTSC